MNGGTARVLANELGEDLTPSAVAVAEDGALLFGRAAKDRLVIAPDSGVAFFKRDMGTPASYRFGGRRWSPVECSAVILREMKRIAGTEACAMAMVETAVALGAWQPDVANRLAQKAFPHLPTDRRAELVSAVDHEAAIGRVLGPLPNDH